LILTSANGCGSSTGTNRRTSGEGASAAPLGALTQQCGAASLGVARIRVTGAECDVGRNLVVAWQGEKACAAPSGSSRRSCAVSRYRCLAVKTEQGLAVDCARPGRSISFVVRRR
jgi:hypothetical protein